MNDKDEAYSALREMLDDYQSRGYQVFIESRNVWDNAIDAYATKGDRIVSIQARERSGEGLARAFVADEPDVAYVNVLLRELESLLRPETPTAAILVLTTHVTRFVQERAPCGLDIHCAKNPRVSRKVLESRFNTLLGEI